MGDPKKQRKKYETPLRPWDKKIIQEEAEILRKYGLRRKREIYRAESILRNFRRQARRLAAEMNEDEKKKLIGKLNRLGFVEKNATLDDILSLTLEDVLNRRLQTIVFKKSLANTIKQARQFIVHGHVKVGDRKIRWPSFIVPKELENEISVEIGGKK
ncbi:MAG: 30S ribosomal protein S4 [Candidatus Aenigmarchaeota archaeon]|nr:30S ribosomal protein S4 [Candidatus Aenigmarchaeota archaeon]